MSQEHLVPEGWKLVPLNAVTADIPNFDPSRYPEREFSYVDISSIDNRRFCITEPKCLLGHEAPSRARRPITSGDVLFSNVRTYLRNIAEVQNIPEPALASTGFTVLRPTDEVVSRYLFHYVRSDKFVNLVTPQQTGTQYPATSDRVVRNQLVPLPPVSVQRQIASVLDRIEERTLSSSKQLAAARYAVERFRQAVLADAYKAALEEAGQPILLGEMLREPMRNGYSARPVSHATERRVLTLTATTSGWFDETQFKYTDDAIPFDADCWVQPGDILVQRGNTAEYVGVPALYTGAPNKFIYPDLMIRVRPRKGVSDHFLWYMLLAPQARGYLRARATGSAGNMPKINQTTLASVPVPVPGQRSQERVVLQLDRAFGLASSILARINAASQQVERSAQAVLAKAFRGELTSVA